MKNIELLYSIANLFDFKVIKDSDGNEYVVYNNSSINFIESPVEDKTAFEALENHVHIPVKQKKSDFDNACFIGQKLGNALLSSLRQAFRDKNFIVFAAIHKDEIIIRFHQKWESEPVYYDVEADYGKDTKLYAFE